MKKVDRNPLPRNPGHTEFISPYLGYSKSKTRRHGLLCKRGTLVKSAVLATQRKGVYLKG